LRGLVNGAPLTVAMFRNHDMASWVRHTIATVKPAAVFLYSSAVAQYLSGIDLGGTRVVMDFVDVDSDKWRQYAAAAAPPMKWVYAREAARLLSFDRAVAAQAQASVLVSDAEAELFRKLAPESAAKIHAVANGIDCDYFNPAHVLPNPFAGLGPHLVFTGTMDYRPNVDAVVWFVRDILPQVRAFAPEATFTIVGAKPSRDVMALADVQGVTVTGRVDDVRAYVRHADVVVAPLRLARGIQNKVLEGMAMGRPVVTTPQGLEGIDAVPDRDLLVAETPTTFAAAVRAALAPSAEELGRAARKLMLASYAWPSRLAALDTLLAV
jgi:sugar transferase (PEP-CTERM/EpsH1 system associated)